MTVTCEPQLEPGPPTELTPAPKTGARKAAISRVQSLDLLRGIVVILMVVDHARFFLSDARFSPTDLSRTTAALFMTRWITHFCAPVFSLLAGAGAYLSLARGRTPESLSRFLATRGLWLILLELTVARFGWQFNFDYSYSSILVFWSLGSSMLVLALLVRFPVVVSLVVGSAIIALHDLTATVAPAAGSFWGALWTLLHRPGVIPLGANAQMEVMWTALPWVGVMAVGYAFGAGFLRASKNGRESRDRFCYRLGLALFAAFVVLRTVNGYGDPSAWQRQSSTLMTVLSFVNATKYPASLDFVMMTLGPGIAALPLIERWTGHVAESVLVIGRVPLFFWLLHVPLLHAIAVGLSLARYGEVIPWLTQNPPASEPAGYGYGLGVVYLVTVAVVLLLLPLCQWYRRVKERSRNPLLSYL